MASTSPISHTDAQNGWERVDDGLAELERLAGEAISDQAFFTQVCQQLVQWGLAGAAVWTMAGKRPQLACYHAGNGLPREPLTHQDHLALTTALQAAVGSGLNVSSFALPAEGNTADSSANRSNTLLIPWRQDDRLAGAVQIVLPPEIETAAHRGFAQMGRAVADLVALFQNHHDRRQWQEQFEDLQRWQGLLRGLQGGFDLQQTAYKIAHDGRPLLGCDRLAVVLRQGTRYRVQAVSGAEFVHRRAEVVTAMERVSKLVAATGEPFWFSVGEQELSPQLSEAINQYLDASPAIRLGIIPLPQADPPSAHDEDLPAEQRSGPNEPPFAVLLVEQFAEQDEPLVAGRAARLAEAVRPALRQAWQLQGIPLLSLWLAWQKGAARTTWLSRGAIAVASLLLVVTLLLAIPAEVKLRAPGELQPRIRHEIFAPCDSVVTEVLVDHGTEVQPDSPLLQLRAVDLDLESQRIAGELETVRKQLDATRAERLAARTQDAEGRLRQRKLTADEEQFAEQIRGLEAQQKLLATQQAELQVRSPAAGSIITWNARERLAQRPLRRGDLLLTVADESGPWQVELQLPARQAARLFAAVDAAQTNDKPTALPISFALSTAPGLLLDGTIREVSQRVNTDKNGDSYVLVVADISADKLPQRNPGAVVYGRVHVGQGPLAIAWFHEVIDAARLWLTW